MQAFCFFATIMLSGDLLSEDSIPVTSASIVEHLQHAVDGVVSFDTSETLGWFPKNYSRTTWQECGDAYRFSWTRGSDTDPKQNFQIVGSFDGEHGFKYDPVINRVYVQKAPFKSLEEGYTSDLRGPLMFLEFLYSKTTGRIKLSTLKSGKAFVNIGSRMSLRPDKNRSWLGHPCIAVKFADGYNRWDNEPADYIAYFAEDLGFFPVAWEAYNKKGELTKSYWVRKMASVSLGSGTRIKFNYPAEAKFRNNVSLRAFMPGLTPNSAHEEIDEIDGADENLLYSAYKINTLDASDLSIDPSIASYIEDLDTKTLIPVPK